MAGGRPTDYLPEFCDRVIALGKDGKSKAQMAAAFDVARSTIDTWADAHPEFSEALNRAMAHCQEWWETKGQEGMMMPGFNAAVWKKSMEARFRDDYTERKELSGPAGGPIPFSQIELVAVAPDGQSAA